MIRKERPVADGHPVVSMRKTHRGVDKDAP